MNIRISSLLYAEDVVLLVSSGEDLQHALGQFTAESEVVRITVPLCEAIVHECK